MSRINSHEIETLSRTYFEHIIAKYENNSLGIQRGDALVRTISEKDYGVDLQIELFDHGETTGRIAYVQLKGTAAKIEKLRRTDEVSCPDVTESSLGYCKQNKIPVFLVYISIDNDELYFLEMHTCYKNLLKKRNRSKKYTVNIPFDNDVKNLEKLFKTMIDYYENNLVVVSKKEPENLRAGDVWLKVLD